MLIFDECIRESNGIYCGDLRISILVVSRDLFHMLSVGFIHCGLLSVHPREMQDPYVNVPRIVFAEVVDEDDFRLSMGQFIMCLAWIYAKGQLRAKCGPCPRVQLREPSREHQRSWIYILFP